MKPGISGYQTSFAFPKGVLVKANTNGYRDEEWPEKKLSGKKALLLLGDSFGWGWGCDQDSMMSRRIEDKSNYAVYNLCVPGDNLFRHYVRYRNHINQIDAEQVVILNYINDFFDISRQKRLLNAARENDIFSVDQTASIQCDNEPSTKMIDILNYSYLFKFVNGIRNSNRFSLSNERGRKLLDSLFKIGFSPDIEFLTDTSSFPDIRSFYRELLTEIAEKRKVIVVNIPPDYQIDQERYTELSRLFPDKNIDPSITNDLLSGITADIPNLTFLDLTDELKRYHAITPLYIKNDGHLNNRGQVIVGDLISSALKN